MSQRNSVDIEHIKAFWRRIGGVVDVQVGEPRFLITLTVVEWTKSGLAGVHKQFTKLFPYLHVSYNVVLVNEADDLGNSNEFDGNGRS